MAASLTIRLSKQTADEARRLANLHGLNLETILGSHVVDLVYNRFDLGHFFTRKQVFDDLAAGEISVAQAKEALEITDEKQFQALAQCFDVKAVA